jgi:hypothetical protein
MDRLKKPDDAHVVREGTAPAAEPEAVSKIDTSSDTGEAQIEKEGPVFPPEIIEKIIEVLAQRSKYRDLLRIMLASRQMYSLCLPILIKTVDLEGRFLRFGISREVSLLVELALGFKV